MIERSDFSPRCKSLAFVLSVLALCSALWAPAAVMARDLGEGRWLGLCSAVQSGEMPSHDRDDGHCGLCLLSGPALPPAAMPGAPSGGPEGGSLDWVGRGWRSTAVAEPSIRGPPTL